MTSYCNTSTVIILNSTGQTKLCKNCEFTIQNKLQQSSLFHRCDVRIHSTTLLYCERYVYSFIAYFDRSLQHPQSGSSHECQAGYCDSSQVWSQSQCRLPGPEEWLLFPGQSRQRTEQLHLCREIIE